MTGSELISRLIVAGIFLVIAFPLHEFSHAWAANMLGDRTARYLGRLSLDPRVHFDMLGGLLLLISALGGSFIVGWAKPTPVNPTNLRGGRQGEAWVALAGPLSNLIMAAIAAIPLRILLATGTYYDTPVLFQDLLFFLVYFSVFLFIFNLLPIPPLDGYRVVIGLVSPRIAWQLRQYEQYGFVLIIVLFLVGAPIIVPIGRGIFSFLVGQ